VKFGKAAKLIRQAQKMPASVKRKYEESPQRKGIETMIAKRGVQWVYKPLERAIDRAVAITYTQADAKTIKKWAKKLLKKNTDFTEQTKLELREKWPAIAASMKQNTLDQDDIAYLQKEVKPWIEYLKEQELKTILEKRKIIGE